MNQNKDIFYHLVSHDFSRFVYIVNDLVKTYGANEVLNIYGQFGVSPLQFCISRTPPHLERFRYLVEKGAILDQSDLVYKPQHEGQRVRSTDSLIDIWSRYAADDNQWDDCLSMLMEFGEDPNNIKGHTTPLFGAGNQAQMLCLFAHGADIDQAHAAASKEAELTSALPEIDRVHRLHLAQQAAGLASLPKAIKAVQKL